MASQNARQHGATGGPSPTQLLNWYRVIVGAPHARPADLLRTDRTTVLALALAEAEARLGNATAALEAHLDDPVASGRSTGLDGLFDGAAEKIKLEGQGGGAPGQTLRDLIQDMQRRIRHAGKVRSNAGRRERLLRRYAREAQGHRNRCFTSWLAHQSEQQAQAEGVAGEFTETNPFTTLS